MSHLNRVSNPTKEDNLKFNYNVAYYLSQIRNRSFFSFAGFRTPVNEAERRARKLHEEKQEEIRQNYFDDRDGIHPLDYRYNGFRS